MKSERLTQYNALLATNNGNCIKCGKPMKNKYCIDYEDWPTHPKCLGPYDAWIDNEETGGTIYKRGFESVERAEEVIGQDYPEAKHTLIRRVR